VLREYVVRLHGRPGSRRRNKFVNSGSVHIAGFLAGEKASKRIA
jgi:glutaminase